MNLKTLEKNIQQDILRYLKSHSIFHYKNITCNKRGIPDIVAVYNGIPLFLEVKTQMGVLSEIQKYQMEQIRLSGGFAYVVRSVEEVERILHMYRDKTLIK